MTNKVRIPQNVADAIETLRNAEYGDYGIVKYVDDGGPIHVKSGFELQEVLRDWTYENDGKNSDLLLDALRIGYEIELEFKAGDWVARLDGASFYPVGDVKAVEVLSVEEGQLGDVCVMHGHNGSWGTPFTHLRHATPEEIKLEKERRLWVSIGREVKEFREGDIAIFRNGMRVSDSEDLERYYENGDLIGFYPTESFISFEGGDSNA